MPKDIYPVGRLDRDSEGLLILTNDKKFNHLLLDPKYAHRRTYFAEVDGHPDDGALKKLQKGVEISVNGKKYMTRPASAILLSHLPFEPRDPDINRIKHPVTSWLSLTLTEGKNRQVRKMTAAVGNPTLRLVRVAIGELQLGELKPGELRQISGKVIYLKTGIEQQ